MAWGLYPLALVSALLLAVPVGAQEPPAPDTDALEAGETEEEVAEPTVAALLDDNTTKDMHDDTTILRNVVALEDEALVLFDALRIWVGGAAQYDYYNIDGIFNHDSHDNSDSGTNFRRLEGIVRAQLFDWGELKAQYDLDAGIFRDIYLRWVSDRPDTPVTVTIGNQKEPISLENLSGNKFEMAQERSTASDAFGRWRSKGIRLHKAFELGADERKLDIYSEDAAYITTSVGVFTQDIEDSHDTDIAVTGRITGGVVKGEGGAHLGMSLSYREGDFYRISFRPEVREADRITLARPDANTMGIVAVEGAWNRGRLHLQAEGFYSALQGRVDGYGAGAYLQAGWFLTRDQRDYNPRWGILAPHRPSGKYSVELFGRLSHTRGDDDINGWNDYKAMTVGATYTQRKFRTSVNVLYGNSREPFNDEGDGTALVIRAQYLL